MCHAPFISGLNNRKKNTCNATFISDYSSTSDFALERYCSYDTVGTGEAVKAYVCNFSLVMVHHTISKPFFADQTW